MMEKDEMAELMICIIRCVFPKHEPEGTTPSARDRLRVVMKKAGILPPMAKAFSMFVFSDDYPEYENFPPLALIGKHLAASLVLYQVYGPGSSFKSRQFREDAKKAGISSEKQDKIIIRLWGRS